MMMQEAQRRNVLRALATAPWLGNLPAAVRARAADGTVDTFAVGRVRLLGGPFKRAQELTSRYLRSLQADRLLHGFRVNASLEGSTLRFRATSAVDGADLELMPYHPFAHERCSLYVELT